MVVRVSVDILEYAYLHKVSSVATAMIPRSGFPAVVVLVPERVLAASCNPQGQVWLITAVRNPNDNSAARLANGDLVLPAGYVAIYYVYRGQGYGFKMLQADLPAGMGRMTVGRNGMNIECPIMGLPTDANQLGAVFTSVEMTMMGTVQNKHVVAQGRSFTEFWTPLVGYVLRSKIKYTIIALMQYYKYSEAEAIALLETFQANRSRKNP